MRLIFTALFCLLACVQPLCAQFALHTEAVPPNSPRALKAHYVVVVSLDGFRYDYSTLHGAPNLMALAKLGAYAPDGMLPSYPSLTFPNHYTLVTGLRPAHHGIIDNYFFDPAMKKNYSMGKSATASEFYGGMPLWSLAQSQGMRAAAFFWVGSAAKIGGYRPAFWADYEDRYDNQKRIDQVIAWLKLPAAQRPHLIHLYYSAVDHAGHSSGPESLATSQAVHHLDAMIGILWWRLQDLHLPIDLIVTSDHGMVQPAAQWITLDENPSLAKALRGVLHNGTHFYPESEQQAQELYEAFKANPDPRYRVYRRKDVPTSLHYSDNERIGDPVIIYSTPVEIRVSASSPKRSVLNGMHGYDPTTVPQMKAIFFAAGPDIRKGIQLPAFDNVNVYDFVAKLLGLKPAPNDGTLKQLKLALKHP